MKKKIMLLCSYLLVFILSGCTSINSNNTPTSFEVIDSLQLQMNNVVMTVRGLDSLYAEDYIIAPIYSNNMNYNNGYNNMNGNFNNYDNGYINNMNSNHYGNLYNNGIYNNDYNINNGNGIMGNNYQNGYNYAGYNNGVNMYGQNGYNYNQNGYYNYNQNGAGIFSTILPKNIDTYDITAPVVSTDEQVVETYNNTIYSVNNINNTQGVGYGNYIPKYTNDNNLDRTTLDFYIYSLEDLYLISSDISSANNILNELAIRNIEISSAIRNNAFCLNYNIPALPNENLAVVSEYINTIDTILLGLNSTYGYINTEIDSIAPLRTQFYNNIEALNARYLRLINIVDSRIAQLQNLLVSLQRLNTQLMLISNQNNMNYGNNNYYGYQGMQNSNYNNNSYNMFDDNMQNAVNNNNNNNNGIVDNPIINDGLNNNIVDSNINSNTTNTNVNPLIEDNINTITNTNPIITDNPIINNPIINNPIINDINENSLINDNPIISDNSLNNNPIINDNIVNDNPLNNDNNSTISNDNNTSIFEFLNSNFTDNPLNDTDNTINENEDNDLLDNNTNSNQENIFEQNYNSETYYDTNRI